MSRGSEEQDDQANAPPPPPPPPPPGETLSEAASRQKTSEERRALLAQQLQFATARGRRIESHADWQAVLIEGKPVNHVLHVLITIVTCGLWAIVWIVLGATGGEKRELLAIDEWGNVQYQRLGRT